MQRRDEARNGQWLTAAGLVLVRQMPGSVKGFVFVTSEGETGVANVVVWLKLFEKSRRVLLSSSMLGIHGRIHREGEVVPAWPSNCSICRRTYRAWLLVMAPSARRPAAATNSSMGRQRRPIPAESHQRRSGRRTSSSQIVISTR